MSAVNPFHRVAARTRGSVVEVSHGRCWLELFPQHGPGRKHERKIELHQWQREIVESNPKNFLRGLIESDGCRFVRTVDGVGYPSYSFSNRSPDIIELFCWACHLVDIHYTRARVDLISIATRPAVASLDRWIGPKS